MGKTYKHEFVDYDGDMDFDLEADIDFEYLQETDSIKKTGKERSRKRAGRVPSAHRYLPDDWQDFDFGSTADGSWG